MANTKWYNFDGHKLLYHMDRVYSHYRDGNRIYPLHIDIGATKLCNAKCLYCYGLFQKMTSDIIPKDILINLFADAPGLGIKSITVTGDGEPTLNPAIYKAVVAGKLRGLDIGFATNGIALDEAQLNILLKSCTWLRFNLSAVSTDSYKKVHGVNQWERVQANIRTALRLKELFDHPCTIGLQMVLIPQCLDQVIPEAHFALDNKLDYFVIKQFSDPGCSEMNPFSLSWYDQPGVLSILRQASSLSNETTKIVPKWGMIQSKGVRPYNHCVDCPLLFQISGSGKCYPCGYLFGNDEYCYGDLHHQTLKEILDSELYWLLIKKMRYDFDVHTQCKGCCRHDFTNAFIWQYLNPPEHLNFI